MSLPVGLCLECAQEGTVLSSEPIMAFGKCMYCGKDRDCFRADCIAGFFPYVPLWEPDFGPKKSTE